MDKEFLCPQAPKLLTVGPGYDGGGGRSTLITCGLCVHGSTSRVRFHRIVCSEQNHRYENRLSAVLRSP